MNWLRSLKITPKLSLVLIFFAMLLLLAMGIPSYLNARTALRTAAISELLSTSMEKRAALNTWVESRKNSIQDIANQPHLKETLRDYLQVPPGSTSARYIDASLLSDLEPWTGEDQLFKSLQIIQALDGKILISTQPGDVGKYREEELFFIRGLQNAYVENPFYDLSTNTNIMVATAPIIAPDGTLMGVLAGSLDMSELNDIIGRRTGLHQTDDSFLVNSSHLLVTQPHLLVPPSVLQRGIHTPAVNACLERSSGVYEGLDYRGVPAIVVYNWIVERELCLIVKIDQSEAYVAARQLSLTFFLLGFLVLFLGSLAGLLIARTVARPVHALVEGTNQVSRGNLAYRIPVKGGDELGLLQEAFNQMTGSIQEKTGQLQELNTELEQRVQARTEDLSRSNAELERFAYVASHDLQEPLRMVTSYLQLLEKRYKHKLDGDALEFIQFAVDGSMRMKNLINDLLAYSRVGTRGKEFAITDCNEVLASVLKNLKISIDENRAQVTYDDLPHVMADVTQLESLFQNLISNAIKFHGADRPRINIGVSREGSNWVFSISDNGIGIDPQYFERIFIIFQRLHNRQEYPGTGIGLAISKRIVERHGGRIWIDSRPGKGSIFYFTLPAIGETK